MKDIHVLKCVKSRGGPGKAFIILVWYGGELSKKCYKLITHSDGAQLLELAGHDTPDLVMVGH